ncbi:AraC family transcriptional regulator [Cupriavidus basilensis]|uniref:AraC family transcriptional regulator n=1 Tax=Cupriavidus basilensis TaxID=68895 RepID=A0ABT6B0X8_9BURK|nr:AraC family transcriptional regulator [Cupriavidus basilensis]MDF3838273.1 AraC family transcriptional regulator [Cupriavidus basilensis]
MPPMSSPAIPASPARHAAQNRQVPPAPSGRDDGIDVARLVDICAGISQQRPADMASLLNAISLITPLLNAIPNVVFFIKDCEARYLVANLTLATRCGFKRVEPLLGKTSAEVFPAYLGQRYTEQDRRVLDTGTAIAEQLELHLYPARDAGWCMTCKRPLLDSGGRIIGMAGISHDLQLARDTHPAYQRLAAVDTYIREHYGRPIPLSELTALTGLSTAQLERYCKRIFHLTPRQMIHKVRLERASELLATGMPITDIALECGYTDHSAFSRQFKALTGLTPRQFRPPSDRPCAPA